MTPVPCRSRGLPLSVAVLILLTLLAAVTLLYSAKNAEASTLKAAEQLGSLTPTPDPAPAPVEPADTVDDQSSSAINVSVIKTIQSSRGPNAIVANPQTRKAYVASSGRSSVSVLDISADEFLRNLYAGQKFYWGLAVKPGERELYLSDNGAGEVVRISEVDGSILNRIRLGNVYPEGIAIHTGRQKAYVAHSGNLLSVINLADDSIVGRVNTGYYNHLLAIDETRDLLYVTRSDPNMLTIVDTTTDTPTGTVSLGLGPWGVAVNTRTGRVYVTNSGSNSVSVVNSATRTIIATIAVGREPRGIAVNERANRVYVTNARGNSLSVIDGAANTVVETVSNVGSRPVAVALNPNTGRIYVSNENGDNVTVLYDAAAAACQSRTPIVFVPGYYASFNQHIMAPQPNNFEDRWEWWPVFSLWWYRRDAGEVYESLIDALEEVGYISDPSSPCQTLFIAYYNWMRPDEESADLYLDSMIRLALQKTGEDKVNVVTHSNGGLVVRAWVQKYPRSTVIDQLLMIAPPNHGVASAYPAWAGGDLGRESWIIRKFFVDRLMSMYNMPLTCIPTPSGGLVCYYQEEAYFNLMHANVPSTRDLLPAYDFVVQPDGVMKPYLELFSGNRNLFLHNLNQDVAGELAPKVGGVTIVGAWHEGSYNTLRAFSVRPCDACSPRWQDGSITQDLKANGDGTVPYDSVRLPDIETVMLKLTADDLHGPQVVRAALPTLFDKFGLEKPDWPTPVPTPAPPRDALVFDVSSAISVTAAATQTEYVVPVHLLITDPAGRKIGYENDSTFVNQIPNAVYYGAGFEPKFVMIPDPLPGNYSTAVRGLAAGMYDLRVTTDGLREMIRPQQGMARAGVTTTEVIAYVEPKHLYLPVVLAGP